LGRGLVSDRTKPRPVVHGHLLEPIPLVDQHIGLDLIPALRRDLQDIPRVHDHKAIVPPADATRIPVCPVAFDQSLGLARDHPPVADGPPSIIGPCAHAHKEAVILHTLALQDVETRRFFPIPPRPSSNDGGLTSTHNPPTVDAPLVGAILDWWRVALPKRNLFPPPPPALFAEEDDLAQAFILGDLNAFFQSTNSARITTHRVPPTP